MLRNLFKPHKLDNKFTRYLNQEELINHLDKFLIVLSNLNRRLTEEASLKDLHFALEIIYLFFKEFRTFVIEKEILEDYPVNLNYGLPSIGSLQADLTEHFKNSDNQQRFDKTIKKSTNDEKIELSFFEGERMFNISFRNKLIQLAFNIETKGIEIEINPQGGK